METTTANKRYRATAVISKISVERLNSLHGKYLHPIHAVHTYMWVNYPTWGLSKEAKYEVKDIEIIEEQGANIEVGLV